MSVIRRWLFAALALGLIGSAVELVLLEHYEDAWQVVPLALIALAIVLLVWELARPTPTTERLLRTTMGLFVIAGAIGIGLHMNGAAEFQLEIDPQMARSTLLTKVLHAKAPPAFAPGLMIQLGLLGLTFTFTKEKQP